MSVLEGRQFRFSADNTRIERILGIDMQAKMPIAYRSGNYIVFKRVGFTGWSGVGQRDYYPPDYYLVKVNLGGDWPVIEKVISRREASRENWRQIKQELVQTAYRLDLEQGYEQSNS